MKNLRKVMLVASVFALFAFVPVREKAPLEACPETNLAGIGVEDDALICKVYNDEGTLIGKCTFCNCPEFTKELLENRQ